MSGRVVLFRIGECFFSLPFSNVEEIVGIERITGRAALPDSVKPVDESSENWVFTRNEWLPVGELLAGIKSQSRTQVLMLSRKGSSGAYFVDQVLGIETLRKARPIPGPARRCTDQPLSGFRIWKDHILLELDLSRLI